MGWSHRQEVPADAHTHTHARARTRSTMCSIAHCVNSYNAKHMRTNSHANEIVTMLMSFHESMQYTHVHMHKHTCTSAHVHTCTRAHVHTSTRAHSTRAHSTRAHMHTSTQHTRTHAQVHMLFTVMHVLRNANRPRSGQVRRTNKHTHIVQYVESTYLFKADGGFTRPSTVHAHVRDWLK